MVGLIVIAASLAGCTPKTVITAEPLTGDGEVITWEVLTGTELTGTGITDVTSSAMQEFTGEIDSWVVPVVTGSTEVTPTQSAVSAEVNTLIEQSKTQTGDTTKLNEEDIGLMEKIIQATQKIGK